MPHNKCTTTVALKALMHLPTYFQPRFCTSYYHWLMRIHIDSILLSDVQLSGVKNSIIRRFDLINIRAVRNVEKWRHKKHAWSIEYRAWIRKQSCLLTAAWPQGRYEPESIDLVDWYHTWHLFEIKSSEKFQPINEFSVKKRKNRANFTQLRLKTNKWPVTL